MRVLHIISSLEVGGAETTLLRVVKSQQLAGRKPEVVSLTKTGPIGRQLQEIDVPVHALGLTRGPLGISRLWPLARLVRGNKFDIVQTWLPHADLAGGIVARAFSSSRVIWNIRHSSLKSSDSVSRSTRMFIWMCARLSRTLPHKIICCSRTALDGHAAAGYDRSKLKLIRNGFDTSRFRPDPVARRRLRSALGISEEALLVGMVARFHPMKDHRRFVGAAARVAKRRGVTFLFVGAGLTSENQELTGWLDSAGITSQVRLLGPRDDVDAIYPGLDLVVSSSSCCEGLPNVLGEAMAAGVPCVATDVGDSATLLGATGRIVQPRDEEALAKAMLELLELPPGDRRQLGDAARGRVLSRFSLEKMLSAYNELYLSALGQTTTSQANL